MRAGTQFFVLTKSGALLFFRLGDVMAIPSYGKEFKRPCFELSEKIDLDKMPHIDDQQWFLEFFSQHLDSMYTYYAAKMAQVATEKRERFRVIPGQTA